MDVAPDELTDDVLYQLGALDAFCRVAGDRVRYVKPHGALYNTTVDDEAQAAAVVRAVREYDADAAGARPARVGAAAGRRGGRAARASPEGFVDRGYTPQGHAGAAQRARGAGHRRGRGRRPGGADGARPGAVLAVDGTELHLPVRSLCVHGDTPGAVGLARRVRAALEAAGLPPTPFAA